MFDSLEVLKQGNDKQLAAYRAINELRIMEDLRDFNPILCGTIPLAIDVVDSDLDMIMEVYDFDLFKETVLQLFQDKEDFQMKETEIRGEKVVKANFVYASFEFELFGQAVPVKMQNAFVHMQIEYLILEKFPDIRSEIIHLKKQGIKTEPAFCQILGISGKDPYKELINYQASLLEENKKEKARSINT